ncbi:MAG: hypothetical protein EBY28_24100, partial [Betaproteobacteria bacterium]|nr:hypothetical protein [Betaproteobacteria bacterium]
YFGNRRITPVAANSTGQSEIRVMQDAYPKAYYSLGTVQIPDAPQDLYVRGSLKNADGALYLTNMEGSINVTGELRAGTVKLTALGDFNLSTDDWYHVGNDPRQYLSAVPNQSLNSFFELFGSQAYNPWGIKGQVRYRQASGNVGDARLKVLFDAMDAAATKQSIVFAMGEININARYLNLNGVVQSGVDSVDLTIGADFNPSRSSNFTDASGRLLPGISYGAAGLATVDGFFDVDAGAIILSPIKPTGGVINLTGQILSTGNGELRVASGYASVNIINQSKFSLAVDTIDVSTDRIGKITITDTATLRRDEYQVLDGKTDHVVKQGVLESGSGGVSSITYNAVAGGQIGVDASQPMVYQPELGRYYLWTEGQAKTRTTIKIYEQKSFNLLGFDWDGLVPDTEAKSVDTNFTDGSPLLESELLIRLSDPSVSAAVRNALQGNVLVVDYVQKSNPAVALVNNVSLVRDVVTNSLYRYVGESKSVAFPVTDFGDTSKWNRVAQLSGGKKLLDAVSGTYYYAPSPDDKITGVPTGLYAGANGSWTSAKADNRFDSNFANEEITVVTTESGGGWLREKTITTKTTTVTGLKDFYTYALAADKPVTIKPMLGRSEPVVNIQTPGKLLLAGSVSFGQSTANEDSDDFKPIALSSDALEVAGTVVFSGAVPSIVANSDVTVRVKDPKGKLNIVATGNVVIEQIADPKKPSAPLKIGQIIAVSYDLNGVPQRAGQGLDNFAALTVGTAYDVTVLSTDGIWGLTSTSRIVGEKVQLDGGQGLINVRVDSNVGGAGGVAARALGSVTVTEANGDLRLVAPTALNGASASVQAGDAATPQDVSLTAQHGAILDAVLERFVPNPKDVAALIA